MRGRFCTGALGVAIGLALALPSAAAADGSASASFTRAASDPSGQTLQLVVTNTGSVDINDLKFTLNDTYNGASDTFLVSQVSPSNDCVAQNPAGSPHGVACTFVASIGPNAQRTITFVTNPKFPNLGGGQLSVNGGSATPVSGPPNVPPVAILKVSQSAANPLTVNLDATGSYDPDGTIVQYFYSFGDATGAAAPPQTVHTYSVPGTYTISLEVTDDSGARTTTSQTITLLAPPPGPGTGPPPPSILMTLIGKEDANELSEYTHNASYVLIGIGVVAAATGVGVPIALVSFGASLGASTWTLYLNAVTDDPPDADFRVVASARRVTPMRVSDGVALPRAVARAANALFANVAATESAMRAFVTSLDRYSGAVKAGDAGAAAMQTLAAAGFARTIAGGLRRDLALRAALVKALRGAHLDFRVTAAQVRSVLRHRLPAAAVRVLSRAGLSIAGFRRLLGTLSHVKNPRGGSLVSVLGSPAMARSEQAMESYLAAFATAHGG
jgi:PKD domain